MSGTTISWDNSTPAATDLVGLGDDVIRSLKSNLQGGLSAEHLWPSGGGLSGVHALGSARVFVGTSSQVSSADTSGRLMWNSTSSKLHYVGAEGTAVIAGQGGLAMYPGNPSLSATSQFASWFTKITGNSWPTGPITTPFFGTAVGVHWWASASTNIGSVNTILSPGSPQVPIAVVYDAVPGSPQVFLFTSQGSTSTDTWSVNLFGIGYIAA